MIDILTFFYQLLQSLLNLFTLGCIRRPTWERVKKSPAPADIEEGVVDESEQPGFSRKIIN
jgi:hypothetical protein